MLKREDDEQADDEYEKKIGQFRYNFQAVPIGAGTFGKVFKGRDTLNNDAPVAIKVISSDTLKKYKSSEELFLREINILTALKGPHIIELIKVLKSGSGNIYIITKFCNGGSLRDLLKQEKTLSEFRAIKILRQLAQAFVDIEKLDLRDDEGEKLTIMHRDIKPDNILFHNGEPLIADFGFAKTLVDSMKERRDMHTLLGTPDYMAPQILDERKYSYRCDVWSMGIVVYEMLVGQRPWHVSTDYMLLQNILSKPLKFPETNLISEEVQGLLKQMLEIEDDKRLNWKEVLAHPAIIMNKKFEIEQAERGKVKTEGGLEEQLPKS